MKVRECLEKMDNFTEEEREKWLTKLINMFAPESIGTLKNFQIEWINSDKANGVQRPYEEFTKAQYEVIRECVNMETSRIGKMVRSMRGLPLFDMEVELDENPLN